MSNNNWEKIMSNINILELKQAKELTEALLREGLDFEEYKTHIGKNTVKEIELKMILLEHLSTFPTTDCIKQIINTIWCVDVKAYCANILQITNDNDYPDTVEKLFKIAMIRKISHYQILKHLLIKLKSLSNKELFSKIKSAIFSNGYEIINYDVYHKESLLLHILSNNIEVEPQLFNLVVPAYIIEHMENSIINKKLDYEHLSKIKIRGWTAQQLKTKILQHTDVTELNMSIFFKDTYEPLIGFNDDRLESVGYYALIYRYIFDTDTFLSDELMKTLNPISENNIENVSKNVKSAEYDKCINHIVKKEYSHKNYAVQPSDTFCASDCYGIYHRIVKYNKSFYVITIEDLPISEADFNFYKDQIDNYIHLSSCIKHIYQHYYNWSPITMKKLNIYDMINELETIMN